MPQLSPTSAAPSRSSSGVPPPSGNITGGEDWQNPGVEQWILNSDRHFTYNAAGNPTSYTTEYELCEYTYDSEGRCIGMTTYDKSANKPYSKQEYTYDTVVKNLLVCTLTYFYQESGEWKLLSGEKTEITRNADGNITKFIRRQGATVTKVAL